MIWNMLAWDNYNVQLAVRRPDLVKFSTLSCSIGSELGSWLASIRVAILYCMRANG